jgi:hypothetical protein
MAEFQSAKEKVAILLPLLVQSIMKEQKFILHANPKCQENKKFQKLSSNQCLKTGQKIIAELSSLRPV